MPLQHLFVLACQIFMVSMLKEMLHLCPACTWLHCSRLFRLLAPYVTWHMYRLNLVNRIQHFTYYVNQSWLLWANYHRLRALQLTSTSFN